MASTPRDEGPEDANHVVVRVYCLGQMKKLRLALDSTTEQVIATACERFHLDTRITPAAELEIYVPLPKSQWLTKGTTLRKEALTSSDTLMIQTRAANDGPQLMAQIAALDAQFAQYQVSLSDGKNQKRKNRKRGQREREREEKREKKKEKTVFS
ncbi:MAG: hypothetical protein IV100_14520 [Myxococcales bacterium]|nr:hypothetical protein [Myxococcales bacterium]